MGAGDVRSRPQRRSFRAHVRSAQMIRAPRKPLGVLIVAAAALLGRGCASEPSPAVPPAPSRPAAPVPPGSDPVPSSGPSVTSFGGNAFRIVTRVGKVIWLDPWLRNPENPTGEDDLANLGRADLVILTSCFNHGAYEDAAEILRKTPARLIAPTIAYSNDCEPTYRQTTWRPLYAERLIHLEGAETALFDGEVSFYYETYTAYEGFTQVALSFADGPTLYDTGEGFFHTDGSRDAADPYVFVPLRFPPHGPVVLLTMVSGRSPFDPPHIAEVARTVGASVVVPWWDLALTAPGVKEDRASVVQRLGVELGGVRVRAAGVHQVQRF